MNIEKVKFTASIATIDRLIESFSERHNSSKMTIAEINEYLELVKSHMIDHSPK